MSNHNIFKPASKTGCYVGTGLLPDKEEVLIYFEVGLDEIKRLHDVIVDKDLYSVVDFTFKIFWYEDQDVKPEFLDGKTPVIQVKGVDHEQLELEGWYHTYGFLRVFKLWWEVEVILIDGSKMTIERMMIPE